ncbi:MAG TPA: hypothetical protein ENL35_11980 [Chloroflexi bacterium]|nr:hypothetical protein [Chloroflexota bacterium]
MTWPDRIILLATGLVAAYLIWFFGKRYSVGRKVRALYFLASFTVLLVAGLLLILFSYDALANPLVVIVAVLIPAGLSLGLVGKYLPAIEKGYLAFVVIGLAAIAVTRFTGPSGLATAVLAFVHSVAGLLIFFLPIRAVARGEAGKDLIGVTIGGGLIGLGGIALAFLKSGSQLLFFSADFVFAILAPLLLLMALAFAWGFVKGLPEI